MAALLAGRTVSASAAEADVHRATVHRWLREDWSFQAALNRGRRDMWYTASSRLLALAEKAAAVVVTAVEAGDTRAALTLLKGLGLLTGEAPGLRGDDPQALQREAELAAKEAAASQRSREFVLSFSP